MSKGGVRFRIVLSFARNDFISSALPPPVSRHGRGTRRSARGREGQEAFRRSRLYSVRDVLSKDLEGTVRAVAKIGYKAVEFYSPYFDWTPERAKEVRKLIDDLGVSCVSTHNGSAAFAPDNLAKAAELNSILGAKIIVMARFG